MLDSIPSAIFSEAVDTKPNPMRKVCERYKGKRLHLGPRGLAEKDLEEDPVWPKCNGSEETQVHFILEYQAAKAL